MKRCGWCKYWTESSTYSLKPVHRRLCLKLGRFTTYDQFCSKFEPSSVAIYCPVLKEVVLTAEFCEKLKLTECKQCKYRDAILTHKPKGLLKREKRLDFEVRVRRDPNMVDGRDLLKQAIDELNSSGITKVIDSEKVLAMPLVELKDKINEFMDVVETVPVTKEDLLPDLVIDVYNKLVDGELVFLSDELENGNKVIVSNGTFYFRRGNVA